LQDNIFILQGKTKPFCTVGGSNAYMRISCKDILQLPFAKEISVLAGQDGLYKVVNWVNVVSGLEDINYFNEGELVFVRDNSCFATAENLKDCLKNLARRNISGIVFTSKPCSVNILKDLTNTANLLNIPILILSEGENLSNIVNNICKYIRFNSGNHDIKSQLLRSILFSSYKSPSEIYDTASSYGYNLIKKSQVLIIKQEEIKTTSKNETSFSKVQVINKMESSINLALLNHSIESFSTQIEDYIVLLLLEIEEINKNIIEAALQAFYEECLRVFPGLIPFVGIGRKYNTLDYIKKSFKQAQTALQIAKTITEEGLKYQWYEQIGVERIIYNIDDREELKQYYNDMLGLLISYDNKHKTQLLKTLDEYLSCNSIALVSKKLYIHENTVKYRLKRIQEILGKNINYPCHYISLKLAFFIKGIYAKKYNEYIKKDD
jgi:purine catabolism regulator